MRDRTKVDDIDPVQQEYDRLKALFNGSDEKKLQAIDGAIREAAILRIQLRSLNQMAKQSGLVKIHPKNPMLQKELPIARMITRVSSNYLSYTTRIANALGKSLPDDGDDEFENEYS